MNRRLIITAHLVAVIAFALVGATYAARGGWGADPQNTNANAGGSGQNSNANRQGSGANANSGRGTNANARGNNNNAGGNMNAGTNTNANRDDDDDDNTSRGNANNTNSGGGNMNTGAGATRTGGQGSTGAGMGGTLGSTDRKFVMEAAMGGLAEVELGRLAVQRGASDAVKQFGQRMIDDHTRANQELMQLVSDLGVTLPTALDAKHQALVAKMSRLSGAEFDRAYARQMVKDHEKTVSLFQREAQRGTHGELKAFASRTLPALQEHLSMARALPGATGQGSTSQNTGTSRH